MCRDSAGICDLAEFCTGTTTVCPSNTFRANTWACRNNAGTCDETEFCTGSSASCPADTVKPANTECRAAAGTCDVAEKCNGTSATCPANAYKPSGTACDDGLFCTGPNNTDTCNNYGVCSGPTNTCSDGNACTTDACNEDTNTCDASPSSSPTCQGKMTGGGQIGCPDCDAGRCSRHNNKNKTTFGFVAEGQPQKPAGTRGGAKGRFNLQDHSNDYRIRGPVTFIHYAYPTAQGGEMRFRVTGRQHDRDNDRRDKWDDDDEDNDCVHYCTYDVTAKDQQEPGNKPPYDFLKVEYVSGPCQPYNTGDQPLRKGNIQWHDGN
jgi:hypothetical protein